MIKINELKGPSCLTSAADDEPVFVLRANDELAPDMVRRWATKYYESKMDEKYTHTQEEIMKIAAKYEEANTLARQMEEWRTTKTSA
jgi:hypothetical protein